MSDILTYLESQLATFDEVPFNAVDSALLAQFCMARGEGIMPRMVAEKESRGETVGEETGHGRGPLAVLRRRLRERRERGRSGKAGETGKTGKAEASAGGEEPTASAARLAVTGVTRATSASAVSVPDATAAFASAATSAAPITPDAANEAEERQDATAPTAPIRFVDLLRAECFGTMFSGMHQAQMKQQLFLMAASPRFRDLLIYDHVAAFDETLDMQFAATTFVCPGRFAYVGFRGTDTTLTGWREDFNMAYTVPVPAQDLAARYVEAVAADPRLPRDLLLGGHSKGGNLAEYAALTAAPAVQDRIAHLYNHDGPGFMPGTFSAADYAPLAGRMTKQVPEDSMVGILMESAMPTATVKATGRGFEQHSVYRWEVADATTDAVTASGAGKGTVRSAGVGGELAAAHSAAAGATPTAFATVPALPDRTERRAEALDRWLASMDGPTRKQMVDALFNALKAAGITDAAQLFEGGREWAILRDGVMKAPVADRTTMLNALRGLTRAFSDVTAARNNARRAGQKK